MAARTGRATEGAARLRFEYEVLEMGPGRFVNIPAHRAE
jgi:hypothetical protein